ncbi:MAG: recombinase family protein [Planctomycetes bacterium]|nr:recombinase family protein [Planctomycetota bacterium]
MIATAKKRKRKSTAKLRGATYIRMSSDKQEDSPERQQADIDYIPEYKTADLVEQYADHAISGTASGNRPDFQRMMRDADDGRFDVLFCSELSRLTREEPIETRMRFTSRPSVASGQRWRATLTRKSFATPNTARAGHSRWATSKRSKPSS